MDLKYSGPLRKMGKILLGILAAIFLMMAIYFFLILIPQANENKGTLVPSSVADIGKHLKQKYPNAYNALSDEELGKRTVNVNYVQLHVPGFGIIYLTQSLPDKVWRPIAKTLIMSRPEYEISIAHASQTDPVPERYYRLDVEERINKWKFVLNWKFLWMTLAAIAGILLFASLDSSGQSLRFFSLWGGIALVIIVMVLSVAAGVFALWLVVKIIMLVWRSFA